MSDNKESNICKTFTMGKRIVSDNISQQAPSEEEWVLWEKKIAHHTLIVNILPFIIIIFSLMIVHIMRLLSYLSSTSSARGDIVAVPPRFLPFVC